jgi:threonine/homoserine/homoserine lactone efflux protein
METLMATAGMVTVAAITPGPNNFVVMRAGARAGWLRALPEMAGAVLGTFTMLVLVVLGGDILFSAVPRARTWLALGGALYLVWLGLGLVVGSFRRVPADAPADAPMDPPGLPSGAASLFVFQFLNPKGWVMVLTASAAAQGSSVLGTLAWLGPVFLLIPSLCLVAWAALGSLFARALRRRAVQVWFDRVMGVLLCASALPLLA